MACFPISDLTAQNIGWRALEKVKRTRKSPPYPLRIGVQSSLRRSVASWQSLAYRASLETGHGKVPWVQIPPSPPLFFGAMPPRGNCAPGRNTGRTAFPFKTPKRPVMLFGSMGSDIHDAMEGAGCTLPPPFNTLIKLHPEAAQPPVTLSICVSLRRTDADAVPTRHGRAITANRKIRQFHCCPLVQ
jgi:hypothetical protein